MYRQRQEQHRPLHCRHDLPFLVVISAAVGGVPAEFCCLLYCCCCYLMLMVSMLCLSSLHAGNGFITFAIVPAVVGVPTVLVVLLLLSFMLSLAFLWVVGGHVIAVILAVACCWRQCYSLQHHCCCMLHC